MRLGRGQHKNYMRRRLFQYLKQGIESIFGKHVDLVYDKDLVSSGHRSHLSRVLEISYLLDTPVGGRVYFDHIEKIPLVGASARITLVAGLSVFLFPTVQCFGEYPGQGGLARAPG